MELQNGAKIVARAEFLCKIYPYTGSKHVNILICLPKTACISTN